MDLSEATNASVCTLVGVFFVLSNLVSQINMVLQVRHYRDLLESLRIGDELGDDSIRYSLSIVTSSLQRV